MTVKNILIANEEIIKGKTDGPLRTKFCPIDNVDDSVISIVNDLRDTFHSDTLSVGLAAPQIGYREAIIIVNLEKKDKSKDLILINPVISKESGQKDIKYESCMSIPHQRGKVCRRKKVQISYVDLDGVKQEISATGFLARVLMHEIDHVNGMLYTDRMELGEELEATEMFRESGIK